ncbi:hypothetical protein ABZ208_13830 [Streptomyces sp. NPDC006208]|uniref:hypothetical protein n=1 Tax=Streptomyces sp. NPDC006208 TaxID=3156734 RepID=UPI00339EB87F
MSLTYFEADAAVRATAHRFANTHLPFEKRWELAREHEANLAAREAALQAIPYPDETDVAWSEHAERERIIRAYRGAHTKTSRTAARWEAYEYDLANPGTSSLVAQLDDHLQSAA